MRLSAVKKFCHEAALWRRLNHQNITLVLGVTMDPYQVVFDRVSDRDIVQYTLNNGVDRAILVSFISDPFPVPARSTGPFPQISDVAEGLGYLNSQNVIHGRLRGVSHRLHPQRGSQLTASGRRLFWSATTVGPC